MKCTTCGAEIKAGNMYCSKCGAEVQIVSADHVMEDELLFYFQNEDAQRHTQRVTSHDGTLALQKKHFYICALTAILGFLGLLVIAFLLRLNAGREQTESFTPHELALVRELAASRDEIAMSYLEQSVSEKPDDLAERFWIAWLYGRQGKREKQIQTLQSILAIDGENIYACRELIRVYVENNDFEALHGFYDVCADSPLEPLFQDYLVDAPAIEVADGILRAGDTMTIVADEGLNVYYTMDGSSPTSNGTLYYAPVRLEAGTYNVQAVACNEVGYYSTVVSRELTVERHYQLGMPQVTPDSGEYLSPQNIYINVPQGCSAYYTWNGSTPTTSSKKYNGSISMPEGNNVLSVILVDAYGNTSSIQRMNYIYMP